jgi:cytochrome c oxidase subunit 3
VTNHPTQPPPPILDVSHLPETGWDHRSPVWWGNTLLIFIETTTVVLLLASFFYCWRNFDQFPPPNPNRADPYDVLPSLAAPTINLILLLGSCLPMYLLNTTARRLEERGVRIGLVVMFLLSVASVALRFWEFQGLKFRWNDNAYGSLIWTILGLHLTYILAGVGEFLIMGLWALTHPLDAHHAHDVTVIGAYWYWVAGTFGVIYMIIYIAPRYFD